MKQLFQDYFGVSGFKSEQSQHNSHLHNTIPGFNPKAQRCFSHVPKLVCAIMSWTLQEQPTDIFLCHGWLGPKSSRKEINQNSYIVKH